MSRNISGMLPCLMFATVLLCSLPEQLQAQTEAGPSKPDSPEVEADIGKAKEIAGTMWRAEAGFFCESPHATNAVDPGSAKLFDNLYAIPGQYDSANGVVYLIRTSDGLVLIDSGWLTDVGSVVIAGMKTLGLDPSNVKIVIVTHGHADHYGGSAYFQDHFGARVALSATDWDYMLNPLAAVTANAAGQSPTPPKRDVIAVEGQPITIGDEIVIPVLIPGDTPGSMGLIFPVKDGFRRRTFSALDLMRSQVSSN